MKQTTSAQVSLSNNHYSSFQFIFPFTIKIIRQAFGVVGIDKQLGHVISIASDPNFTVIHTYNGDGSRGQVDWAGARMLQFIGYWD